MVYRVANSVEILGACRQVSHQRVVEDACMQARLASVFSPICAQTIVAVAATEDTIVCTWQTSEQLSSWN